LYLIELILFIRYNVNKNFKSLLGLNGAGKTTTFKILTGELKATEGTAYINGYNINTQKSKARRNLGFCPQFDYLVSYIMKFFFF